MKFENLLIQCSNNKQVTNAENLLKSIGYRPYASHEKDTNLFIHVYSYGEYQRLSYDDLHDAEKISFKQFMKKYGSNTMIEKINQAKKQLKFNNSEISTALGYSRQYITKMLTLPQTKKVQDKVICQIDELLSTVELKDSDSVIEENKTVSLQKDNESLKSANSNLINQLDLAQKIHNEDVSALKSKDIELNDAVNAIDLLNKELEQDQNSISILNETLDNAGDRIGKLKEDLRWSNDRIVCERWLFLIIIAVLLGLTILK